MGKVQIIGIASEFGNCEQAFFQFIPVSNRHTMLWILSKIQSGECLGFYKP